MIGAYVYSSRTNTRTNVCVQSSVDQLLDQESESEVDPEDHPCEAVKVGIMVQGKMRPLAPEGCRDAARGEPTLLLVEDGKASDLSMPSEGTAKACLCER